MRWTRDVFCYTKKNFQIHSKIKLCSDDVVSTATTLATGRVFPDDLVLCDLRLHSE